ncbi:tRNA pseudouridine(38-40) synthase TruA [bacterium]|nr:tRNA pseudouridine(38-40) synthase TruA [bacterium]
MSTRGPTTGPPRVKIDLAYVGTAFHGWQVQPDQRTVQGELAAMLARLLDRPCLPVGAGRTDAGVHARGQVAHAELRDRGEVARVVGALAKLTPDDVHVHEVREVSPAFDARRSALWRRYEYRLRRSRNIFDPHAFEVPWSLDRAAMEATCTRFLGTHDFASLCKAGSLKEDNRCTITRCDLEWEGAACILRVQADRFLHHMVRNLVGVLVEIGRGARRPEDVEAILAAGRREAAGMMAPPQGLFLDAVGYPDELLDPGYLPAGFTPRPDAAQGDEA